MTNWKSRPRMGIAEERVCRGRACRDDVGLLADQLLSERWYQNDVIAAAPKVHPHTAAISPT
jgi:hypothetical protein